MPLAFRIDTPWLCVLMILVVVAPPKVHSLPPLPPATTLSKRGLRLDLESSSGSSDGGWRSLSCTSSDCRPPGLESPPPFERPQWSHLGIHWPHDPKPWTGRPSSPSSSSSSLHASSSSSPRGGEAEVTSAYHSTQRPPSPIGSPRPSPGGTHDEATGQRLPLASALVQPPTRGAPDALPPADAGSTSVRRGKSRTRTATASRKRKVALSAGDDGPPPVPAGRATASRRRRVASSVGVDGPPPAPTSRAAPPLSSSSTPPNANAPVRLRIVPPRARSKAVVTSPDTKTPEPGIVPKETKFKGIQPAFEIGKGKKWDVIQWGRIKIPQDPQERERHRNIFMGELASNQKRLAAVRLRCQELLAACRAQPHFTVKGNPVGLELLEPGQRPSRNNHVTRALRAKQTNEPYVATFRGGLFPDMTEPERQKYEALPSKEARRVRRAIRSRHLTSLLKDHRDHPLVKMYREQVKGSRMLGQQRQIRRTIERLGGAPADAPGPSATKPSLASSSRSSPPPSPSSAPSWPSSSSDGSAGTGG